MTPIEPAAAPDGDVRVCAVIVHHRGFRLLARCLEALVSSRGVDLRIVIVANACKEALPGRADDDDRIHVVRSDRAIGFSEANNLGASWAREHLDPCDYLFFVNNDTIVETSTIARLVDGMAAVEGCAIAGPQLMIWGADRVLNSLGLNVTVDGEAWDEGIGRPLDEYAETTRIADVLAVTGAALIVRRDVLEEIGGWSELYGFYFEDVDLCLRARSHGWTVLVVRDARMAHAISATAARGSDMKRQLSWRNRFLLILVHWPWRLLLTIGWRMAAGECGLALRRVRARAWSDLRLQLRSWAGAARRWPGALAERRLRGSNHDWCYRLRPRGSVPEIRLPELPDEAAEVAAESA